MHPDQILFFKHGFSSAEHTDHTALRAHFRDRSGLSAVRGVPMFSSGQMEKLLRAKISWFIFTLKGFPLSPNRSSHHAHVSSQSVRSVKSACPTKRDPCAKTKGSLIASLFSLLITRLFLVRGRLRPSAVNLNLKGFPKTELLSKYSLSSL